jgi:Protein of unknown function (DUF3551)
MMRLVPIRAGRLALVVPFAAFVVLALVLALARPAAAQTNYPWCSNFADGFGGTNCGFVSYEQCMETVRGSGGFCDKNNMYQPQCAGTAPTHKPHKTTSHKSLRKSS